MAYLEGTLSLAGCVDNDDIAAGTAEIVGVATRPPQASSTSSAPPAPPTPAPPTASRAGLFEADAGHYEIAASRGPWAEDKFRLKLNRPAGVDPAYDGTLTINPGDDHKELYTLGAGRAQTTTASANAYATGHVVVDHDGAECG